MAKGSPMPPEQIPLNSPLVDLLLASVQALLCRVLQNGLDALIHRNLGDPGSHEPRSQHSQSPAGKDQGDTFEAGHGRIPIAAVRLTQLLPSTQAPLE